MDSGIAAILGVIIGLIFPTLQKYYELWQKGKRYQTAIKEEIVAAIKEIDKKMNWVSRDTTQYIHTIDSNLVVDIDNRVLFLGEKETMQIDLDFWTANYSEIVTIIPTKPFKVFCAIIADLKQFVIKFHDMKYAFICTTGNSAEMATVCYHDLQMIYKQISKNKTFLLRL